MFIKVFGNKSIEVEDRQFNLEKLLTENKINLLEKAWSQDDIDSVAEDYINDNNVESFNVKDVYDIARDIFKENEGENLTYDFIYSELDRHYSKQHSSRKGY